MDSILELINFVKAYNSPVTDVIMIVILTLVTLFVVVTVTRKTMGVVLEIRDMLKKQQKTAKDYTPEIFLNVKLNKVLNDIRSSVSADRALVVQLHNGEKSIANNPFLKFTSTHEALGAKIPSISRDINHVPVGMCGCWAEDLFNHKHIAYHDLDLLDEMPEMRGLYQFISKYGVRSVYIFPLVDVNNNTYGMGIIHYTTKKVELSLEEQYMLKDRFKAFGTLLAHGDMLNEN